MASNNPQVHHGIPPSLLTLHQKANGTSLDGEGIQAWVEWEMEAMRWGVPVEISREGLEALVDSSEAQLEEGHQLLPEGDRSEPETAGGAGTILKPLRSLLGARGEHGGDIPPRPGSGHSRGFEDAG